MIAGQSIQPKLPYPASRSSAAERPVWQGTSGISDAPAWIVGMFLRPGHLAAFYPTVFRLCVSPNANAGTSTSYRESRGIVAFLGPFGLVW